MTVDTKLTAKINDQDVELFMSFGLLNRLTAIFSQDKPVENAMFDEETRTEVLCLVLQKRGTYGLFPKEQAEKLDIDELDISVDELAKVFTWVMQHVTDFFLRAMEATLQVAKENKERQLSLVPSESGSPS